MKSYCEKEISDSFQGKDYDIAKSHNARWLDQKCAADVVTIVADCITQYAEDKPNTTFSSVDIWRSNYTVENVLAIFKKPSPDAKIARNEYDKFFQQPMEMLSYAGVLEKIKVGNRNLYAVGDKDMLAFIALRERNALSFMAAYIEKVMTDSGLWNAFERFFAKQTKEEYNALKTQYSSFIRTNTPINGEVECNRIFIKVLNTLAYCRDTCGTERGHLSKDKVTFDMLMYNRNNFRDLHSEKPKGVTRKEHEPTHLVTIEQEAYYKYLSNKAKRVVKNFNLQFRSGVTEYDRTKFGDEPATHIHHIFPAADFPAISFYFENLIALTPTQHLNHAHTMGTTIVINRKYQYLLILAKIASIKTNLSSRKEEVIYDFHKLLHVLHIGLSDEVFKSIAENNYDAVIHQVNLAYNS